MSPKTKSKGVAARLEHASRRERALKARVHKEQRQKQALQESEERLQLAQRAGKVGVFDWDLVSGRIFVTPELEKLFGVPAGGLEGKYEGWAKRVHPEDLPALEARFEPFLRSDQSEQEGEYRVVRPDGQVRWLATWLHAVRDANGKPLRVVGTNMDITERKRAEAALQRSQRLLQDVLDGSTNVIFVKDLQRRFVLVNRAFERVVGKSREELLGHTDHDLFPRHLADYYEEHDRQALAAGGPTLVEELAPILGGGEHFFLSNKFPLVDAEGKCYGLCCIAMDITDRKRMEQVLSAAKEELARANQGLEETVKTRTAELSQAVTELEQFSHAIMHDMRAPLRAVHSYITLMKESCAECESPLNLEFLNYIQAAVGRMDSLVTDSLDYTKVLQEKMPLRPVNLDELVRDLIHSYPNLQPAQADIQIDGPLPVVLGNAAGLVQCFSNLLGNAVKFVAPGTRPCVRIWSELRERIHRIWVEDNGVGIAPEYQQQIFRMFHRLYPKQYEGTGIGLAVVEKAVERMGGRVGVESEPGRGSRFWVELRDTADFEI